MLLTAHLLTGAFVGKESNNITLALVLGFISHYLLDSIPHNDGPDDGKNIVDNKYSKKQYILVICDIALSISIFYFLFIFNFLNPSIICGAIGAMIPDLIEQISFLRKFLMKFSFSRKIMSFHNFVQRDYKINVYLGLGIQYIIGLFFLFFLIR